MGFDRLIDGRDRRAKLAAFIDALRVMDKRLDGFDEGLFAALAKSVTVGRDGKLTFGFADGGVS